MTRRTTAVAGIAVLAALSAGCDPRNLREMEFRTTETVGITEVRIVGGDGGDVIVTTADRTDTQVDRVVHYSTATAPDTAYRIEGTALVIDADCGPQCGVDYTVSAPRGVRVTGRSDSGDVRLTGVGAVDLKVDSGSLTADGVSGPVRVESDSGDVRLANVTGTTDLRVQSGTLEGRGLAGTVTAAVESGDADLALAAPASVTVTVDSGDLTLRVPDGKYRVRTAADSGQVDVGIDNDPAATAVLDLRADSGDLNVLRG
ncbi:DUF4097 family beta strand repeat-containing protein [Catenuloplanes atrovinosus]|uniref:DUF4097 domain-containing protein n=1 Tax=Catenuloplanes atrovinosus TaxID=137266 RepID=A0AAE4CBY2_9ACTN|nr:DUF4097 family beta strand repeat-containing protein [Catenuloplanes atrovinosus]MDR7278593.1 hypothetical protein [Catenuloplanes atrovinosus]